MWFGVIALFPEILQAMHYGITGRGLKNGLLSLNTWNPRDFSEDKHHSVDDKPYGGGPGMVMMAQPLSLAVDAAKKAAPKPPRVIYLSPQGAQFTQAVAEKMATQKSLILVAGRYEGVDERFLQSDIDEEWSIGDYVLSGGELAAMVVIDTISRLIPGVVKEEESVTQDSLSCGLLKYPQYTRPEEFKGKKVPEVLRSGNHRAIAEWRLKQALGKTWLKRADLFNKIALSDTEKRLLQEFKDESDLGSL